jgi:gentisate 1,2-dioxygenase
MPSLGGGTTFVVEGRRRFTNVEGEMLMEPGDLVLTRWDL